MELLKHLIFEYGYFGIFLALVGGIVGLPVPDEVLLITIGYYAYLGRVNLYTALISSYLGSVIGISISYLLGAKLGLPFLLKYGRKIRLTSSRIEKAQHLFSKHGKWLLIIGYFIPGVRHLTGYLAGIARLSLRTFILYSYIGALFWVLLFVLTGYELGIKWYYIKQSFETYKMLIYFGISVLLSIIVLLFFFKTKNKKR
ncbi:DedA family protein [Halalkalibacter akibai]|uniref:Alkaline phosphatase like protein n=1 Tax=Halalkalibacter akibai (strain ATCC 43226 / DSM 21942 / CIP 109018 / JCM 9157 / 1139) TaxID=1236973 RepID=W4R145_HALA3|nr:DedA family protein [Halalkalibacter akibai]GAE37274.1 alkaline phosphatase like protein [Halalkalibacter akibai JCM 9157]